MKGRASRGKETWRDSGSESRGAKRMCSDALGGRGGGGEKKKKNRWKSGRQEVTAKTEATRYTPVTMTHGGGLSNSPSFTIRSSSFILEYFPLRMYMHPPTPDPLLWFDCISNQPKAKLQLQVCNLAFCRPPLSAFSCCISQCARSLARSQQLRYDHAT